MTNAALIYGGLQIIELLVRDMVLLKNGGLTADEVDAKWRSVGIRIDAANAMWEQAGE